MKLKKFFLSSAAVVTGASLIATVLTSCAHEDIDEDLMIDLDDAGNLVKNQTLGFKDAVKAALTRSSSWATFKQALADEIVFKWYENRAADDDNPDKNEDFQDKLEELKFQIDKDYNSTVDSCKSKYGANYRFYLQNEYLSAYGGTEESYKHAKLVEKIKEEFISAVFKTNYFGCYKAGQESGNYPHIFLDADTTIARLPLRNPESWPRIGFYAKTNKSFLPGETEADLDANYLARNPDGDYATIQSYVFDRWFETEKPFFSAASLFKYSLPHSSGRKLTDIYNEYKATVPENPTEAFPFFGGVAISNDDPEPVKGTQGFWEWYQALEEGAFETAGLYDDGKKYNGTISIRKDLTDDSQTLLLCTAKDTVATLYTPYAVATNLLLDQLFGLATDVVPNTMDQDTFAANVDLSTKPAGIDDARILKNFFFKNNGTTKPTYGSYIDLNTIYGGMTSIVDPTTGDPVEVYHCPLFKENKDYTFLYGDTNADLTAPERQGVRYVANNFQVNLRRTGEAYEKNYQPWILELNEAGVHAQTIDGWQYINKFNSGEAITRAEKVQRLKDVFKYRVLEKLRGFDGGITSCDLFSESGKLPTYFKDNFADIILELAMNRTKSATDGYMNIFRPIESYKETQGEIDVDKTFFKKINDAEKLSTNFLWLEDYVIKTIDAERIKANVDAVEAANSKIYSYRSEQVKNSQTTISEKIFNNGLLAPLPVKPVKDVTLGFNAFGNTRWYKNATNPICMNDRCGEQKPATDEFITKTRYDAEAAIKAITNTTEGSGQFINQIDSTATDVDLAFSPQIKDAKDVKSNRFWYKSAIVDRLMYDFMGNSTNANAIKIKTYQKYGEEVFPDGSYALSNVTENAEHEIISAYLAPKVMSGDNNYSSIDFNKGDFFSTIGYVSAERTRYEQITNGENCDFVLDVALFNASLAYLAVNNFANFYSTMNTKIQEDEVAYVGYLNQYDWYDPVLENPDAPIEKIDAEKATPFDWTKNAGNIYDQFGYLGDSPTEHDAHIDFSQYWHVIEKNFGVSSIRKTLGGFLGLQTKSSNILNSASGLQDAAFSHFAKSTWDTYDLTKNDGTKHADNEGALFPWQGQKYVNASGDLVEYAFEGIKNPEDPEQPEISSQTFKDAGMADALKLAYKISTMTTIDDVRSMAKAIGEALDGAETTFSKIGEGKIPLHTTNPLTEIKYLTLSALLEKDGEQFIYQPAFNRVVNVELHGEPNEGPKYRFKDNRDCYKIMLTQINKQDVIEKKFTPTWNGNSFVFSNDAPITAEEFWYILASLAMDPAVQQQATSAAVKFIYGDEKLIVHDAQLYNQFDSVWIKDWEKKPIGA